jgi:hypothetical protein
MKASCITTASTEPSATARIASAAPASAVEGLVGIDDPQHAALGPRGAGVGAPAAARRVDDPQLGDAGALERQDRVGVVAGVLVDRQDLERQAQRPQLGREELHRRADRVLVVTERQDDRDFEAGGHQALHRQQLLVPRW